MTLHLMTLLCFSRQLYRYKFSKSLLTLFNRDELLLLLLYFTRDLINHYSKQRFIVHGTETLYTKTISTREIEFFCVGEWTERDLVNILPLKS